MKKLIMSDMDNTLVPIHTQEKFVEIWFRDIAKKLYEYGLDQAVALHAINNGYRAMAQNDGGMKNIDVFYKVACEESGYSRKAFEEVMDDYYATTFMNVRAIAQENPYAVEIASLMRQKAAYAVIATMPMFPLSACDTRLRWVGLQADMFDYATSCDTSSYCKPNVNYYAEILERFGAKPEEALMIGNDVREDMEPCKKLGIDTFLVTDHIITHGMDYSEYRRGSYPDLIAYLNKL